MTESIYENDDARCGMILKHAAEIFDINQGEIGNIINITNWMGRYERHSIDKLYPIDIVITGRVLGIAIKEKKFPFIDDSIMDIRLKRIKTDLAPLIQKLIVNVDGVGNKSLKIEKKTAPNQKIDYDIVTSEIFGLGNMSIAIILKITYANGNFLRTVISKIYPIQFEKFASAEYFMAPDRTNLRISRVDQEKRINNFCEFLFLKEGMIGCWIKAHLLNTNVSSTFARVYDSFKIKGLPLIYRSGMMPHNIYPKRWMMNMFPNLNAANDVMYGCIEMEQLDLTLTKFMSMIPATIEYCRMINIGTIFEILYSKLVLAYFGNVYMMDDHSNNIMVKYVDAADSTYCRHYKITRRGTTYNFYIHNTYVIKYIDFERFVGISDRNKYMDMKDDMWFGSSVDYFSTYIAKYGTRFAQEDMPMINYIIGQLHSGKNTIDNFCRLMEKCLPPIYKTDYSLNNEVFECNLDIPESQLAPNFLNALDDYSPINIPYITLLEKQKFAQHPFVTKVGTRVII